MPLTKKEAIPFLGLEDKVFSNYFKIAGEFNHLPRQKWSRYYFDEAALKNWLEGYKWRTIELDIQDYLLCLDFALAMHFRGYVPSDWGTARQREFGQKITNWVKGQLGEIAVKKFFKREFGLDITLDFDLHEFIVPQDITSILEKGKPREPRKKVGIKTTKPKNAYLILSKNETERDDRKSDVYIFCRVNLPDDHLLRLTKTEIVKGIKNKPHFPGYKNQIPDFTNMQCEVAGWAFRDELQEVSSIPGQSFENGTRFVRKSGELHRKKEDWQELINML